MPNNLFAGRANGVISKTGITVSFEDAGFTEDNTAIIYKLGASLQSFVPGRSINPITSFEEETSYYIVPLVDMDKNAYLNADNTILSPVTSGDLSTGLALKANLASPTFTGTPTVPTAAPGTNTTQASSTAFAMAAAAQAVEDGLSVTAVYFDPTGFGGDGTAETPITLDVIDDDTPAADKTYSSEKIEAALSEFSSGGMVVEEVVSASELDTENTDRRLIYATADVDNGDDPTLYFHTGTNLLKFTTTPVALPDPYVFLTFPVFNDLGGHVYEYTSPTYGVADETLPAATDGWIEQLWVDSGTSTNTVIGFDASATPGNYATFDFGLYAGGGFYKMLENGSSTTTGTAVINGDVMGIFRNGSTFTARFFRAGVWTDIADFTATSSAEQFIKADIAGQLHNARGQFIS